MYGAKCLVDIRSEFIENFIDAFVTFNQKENSRMSGHKKGLFSLVEPPQTKYEISIKVKLARM